MSAHPTPPQFQMPVQDDRGPVSGLAITALVLSLVPGVGLLGVIFGIAALLTMNNSSPARSGKGLAIAGIVVGFVTSALGVLLCAGILLPVLGKARESARELKSRSQLALMTQSLLAYARTTGITSPRSRPVGSSVCRAAARARVLSSRRGRTRVGRGRRTSMSRRRHRSTGCPIRRKP